MKPLLLFAVVALAPLARAQDLGQQLTDLRKAGEEFAAAASINPGGPALQSMAMEYREFSSNFGSLESYVSGGNYEEAIRTLRRWAGRTRNEQIKQTLNQLLVNLEKEQEKRIAALNTAWDNMVKIANEKLARTKSPLEVSKIREEFETFRDYDLSSSGRSTRWLQERVSRATNFLEYWQRMLAAEQAGDPAEALQSLRNLRQNSQGDGFVDQKLLSAKTNALFEQLLAKDDKPNPDSPVRKAIIAALSKIKEPQDAYAVQGLLRKISSIATSSDENQLCSQAQNSVGQFLRMYRDFQAGSYARVMGNLSSDYEFEYSDRIEALKNALRARAAAAANDLQDLGLPKPDESFGAFIRRKAEDAYKAKNWPDLFALLSVYSNATGGGCSRTQGMQEGVRAYIAGQQLEQAGQFKDAAASYSLCLAQVGPLVPRAEAAAALDRLKASGQLTEAARP